MLSSAPGDSSDRSPALPSHTIEPVGDSRAARPIAGESRNKQHEGFHVPSGFQLPKINRVKPRISDQARRLPLRRCVISAIDHVWPIRAAASVKDREEHLARYAIN